MVHHLIVRPRALFERNDYEVAQSKGLPCNVQFQSRLMFCCNTCVSFDSGWRTRRSAIRKAIVDLPAGTTVTGSVLVS
jgi:hypothetical protein